MLQHQSKHANWSAALTNIVENLEVDLSAGLTVAQIECYTGVLVVRNVNGIRPGKHSPELNLSNITTRAFHGYRPANKPCVWEYFLGNFSYTDVYGDREDVKYNHIYILDAIIIINKSIQILTFQNWSEAISVNIAI